MGGQLWAKIALNLADNPKVIGLSDSAFRAFIEAILYSRQHLTDGFLDRRVVAKRWGLDVAAELTSNDPANPSWLEVEGGFEIHHFCEYQTTSDDISEMKAKKSRAGKASVEARRKRKLNEQSTQVEQPVEQELNTSATQGQPESESETETDKGVVVKPTRKTQLQRGWKPSPAGYEYAKQNAPGMNIPIELEKFEDYNLQNNRTNADWDAAWRTWVRNAVKYDPLMAKPPAPPKKQFGRESDDDV
jgi:hypothetical protein